MANIPRAVKKQAREAERIQQQLQAQADQGEGNDPSVLPPVDPQPGEPGYTPPPASDQEVDWENRWKNLKKSHDDTVTDLRTQNQQLTSRIDELTKLVEKASEQEPAVQEPLFSDEEVEKYGEDFLSMVEKVAKKLTPDSDGVADKVKELDDQFKNLVQRQVKTDADRFFDELEAAVPDWEQINERQDFKDWLAAEMPLTGQERQAFLEQAQNHFDAKRATAIFNSWKGEVGMPTHFPDTVTMVETEVDLGQEGNRDTHIFTEAEIHAFYDAKRRGKWKGKEAEARQFEERIFLAQREGRVR